MAETHVPTMEELLMLKQQVAEEIARIRAGMQYDDSERERKYWALRIARCTMNLQTLETEVSHAKNGIPPSYTECTHLDEEMELQDALLSAYLSQERRAQHEQWEIGFNRWGHWEFTPVVTEADALALTDGEQHARVQKERATEHAFQILSSKHLLQWEQNHMSGCKDEGSCLQCRIRIDRARANLEREELYYQQFVAQGEWPERPVLVELAEGSEQAEWEESEQPQVPEKREPKPWVAASNSPSPWSDGWST
jgi:ferredoxin